MGATSFPSASNVNSGNPRVVRRKAVNARTRTAITLDIEESKATGELPPAVGDIVHRLQALALASVAWTTHSHVPARPRYRVLVPLSAEIAPDLPAVEILARKLGVEGVIDRSKRGPASLFYIPSAACFDDLDHHEAHVVAGDAYDASLMEKEAGALWRSAKPEQDRIAAEAHAAAQVRLGARSRQTDPHQLADR